MKTSLAFLALLSLTAAQFGKGKGKGGLGKKGGSGGKSSGSMADLMTCATKCNADVLGVDISSAKSLTNFPCANKLPKNMSGGKIDVVPVLTCVCGQPKFKSTLSCVSKCPGGSMLSMFQGQYDKACQNPKAAAAQLDGLMAQIGGMLGGAKGGSKGGSKGGLGKLGGKGKGKFGKGS